MLEIHLLLLCITSVIPCLSRLNPNFLALPLAACLLFGSSALWSSWNAQLTTEHKKVWKNGWKNWKCVDEQRVDVAVNELPKFGGCCCSANSSASLSIGVGGQATCECIVSLYVCVWQHLHMGKQSTQVLSSCCRCRSLLAASTACVSAALFCSLYFLLLHSLPFSLCLLACA